MDLLNDRGRPVRILNALGRPGGEGQIFAIAGSTAVAKIYHQPADAQKASKLRHQVQIAPDHPLRKIAAWPSEVLVDSRNTRVTRGVVMERVPGKEIHKLYGPTDRQAEFPNAGWDFLIHVATNCAAVFDTLHENGVVMADVNEGNLLVKENDGTVGLIDCDSYQVKNGNGSYLCEVGVPMWTPPELQGVNFAKLVRTPNHDRFGLAVLIFRLLFMGRHPFAGIPTGREQFEIEEAIKNFLFAFAQQTWARGVKQPPHSLSLSALPPKVRALFERAFLNGSSQPNGRPSGREWATELGSLKAALKKGCVDPGHKFWHGLTTCPWCDIANAGGPNFFISISIQAANGNIAVDITTFWTTAERVFKSQLMRETVTAPAIGNVVPKQMPYPKPLPPRIVRPIAPAIPKRPAAPVVPPPTLPEAPTLQVPRIAKRPLGKNERSFRVAALLAIFCTIWFDCWIAQGAVVLTIAGILGVVGCLYLVVNKWRKARVEYRARNEADALALKQEKQRLGEVFIAESKRHGLAVAEIIRKHAFDVAMAESKYYQAWVSTMRMYQFDSDQFAKEFKKYEGVQAAYERNLNEWNAEGERRKSKEASLRGELDMVVGHAQRSLKAHQQEVVTIYQKLDGVRQYFEKARAEELSEMRKLHDKREEMQLRQFLRNQRIADATIPKVGDVKKQTLVAYGFGSALDIRSDMRVPGFGDVLVGNLLQWRLNCERKFKYNPNVPLPAAEVNPIKMKYAQAKQRALTEMRTGAARLETIETNMRNELSRDRLSILKLAREHAQAAADLRACA